MSGGTLFETRGNSEKGWATYKALRARGWTLEQILIASSLGGFRDWDAYHEDNARIAERAMRTASAADPHHTHQSTPGGTPIPSEREAPPAPVGTKRVTGGRTSSVADIVRSWDYPVPGAEGVHRAFSDGAVTTYAHVEEADPEAQRAADVALRFACFDLGIDAPRLIWFAEEASVHALDAARFRHSSLQGISNSETQVIGVRCDISAADICGTTAHECFHLTQPRDAEYSSIEPDALAYGDAVRDLLVSSAGRVGSLHVLGRCPLRTRLGAGVIETGDIALTRRSDGTGAAAYGNWGTRSNPQWVHRVDLPLTRGR